MTNTLAKKSSWMIFSFLFPEMSSFGLPEVESIARNCSLRLEHLEMARLNTSDMSLMMRLYNMCEHTWDPDKTWYFKTIQFWRKLHLFALFSGMSITGRSSCRRSLFTGEQSNNNYFYDYLYRIRRLAYSLFLGSGNIVPVHIIYLMFVLLRCRYFQS